LGNYLLKEIIGIGDYIFAVNPFEGKQAKSLSVSGIKRCLSWLKTGGCIAAFPSGEVASWNPRKNCVADPDWSPHIAAMIRISQASVLPIFFPGRNSLFFMAMGFLHPRLRTALLPRELSNKSGQRFCVRIGRAIPWNRLRHFPDDRSIINYLRIMTEVLKVRQEPERSDARFAGWAIKNKDLQPVIPAVSKQQLKWEIARLPKDQCLLEKGDFAVFFAQACQIPYLLNEIGRLREITFREVKEGTGRAVDLDQFDAHYTHLFLWNHAESELVGGYRLGLTDKILKEQGVNGLYTHSLFRFKAQFIQLLPPAIEFGRSFVRPEYQKKFNSLVLIWRGIGQYIRRYPQYKVLFGPVSISRDYQAVSKSLLVHFLKENNFHEGLSRYVSPRQPYRLQPIRGADGNAIRSGLRDIEKISFLISEIENDGKGVPVLLKHYLKLNGKLLSFNIDNAFSNSLDGLLMVDLRETDPKITDRFIGLPDFLRFSSEGSVATITSPHKFVHPGV
jgi:putative hemolysin